jgi:hypothetical protein
MPVAGLGCPTTFSSLSIFLQYINIRIKWRKAMDKIHDRGVKIFKKVNRRDFSCPLRSPG